MITSEAGRISAMVAAGQWGSETLHGLLYRHAMERPDHLAVKDQPNRAELTGDSPVTLSWKQLDRASENLACELHARGLNAGDTALIQLPNICELLVVYYAVSKLGAIASPVPVQYGSHELQHISEALQPSMMITLLQFRADSMADNARQALPWLQILAFGRELELDAAITKNRLSDVNLDANQVLTICWTSGTTGTPKGVPRSHNLWLASGRCTAIAGTYVSEDILLNPFPMVNMSALGGFVFPAALLGCSLVLHHPLDPTLFLTQMQEERVTFTIAPPALLNQLAKSPELWHQFQFDELRAIGSGSAPLSPAMIRIFGEDFGVEVINIYGSNEGIALFATARSAPDPEVRASMFPRPGDKALINTRVVDAETGLEQRNEGDRGELLVAGATVFDGYYEHDNVDVFTADGFFRTGDLVEICGQEKVFYKIVGRCKDIINRGGMKISPIELDLALEQHPGVAEAAACAYPDERLGEKICACMVMQDDEMLLTIAELQEYLLGMGFAKFKLPERVVEFDSLPRNALGKVQRFLLQDRVSASKDSDIR
ncbi:MAG: acyl-CoA synthetase (AMP-forming)/AMP-acid ligase II [Alcanivorax sp.]|jgi:acyl-CoA synthetase (AMP-forming)/AMP-acid ligase II